MLVADTLIKRFSDRISIHAQSTRSLAAGNMLDQAVLSEGLCRDLASILLQRSFKSTNTHKANGDTIDLHDQATPPICAQVTIREDREKITSALEAFFAKGYDKKYDSIYFFIIGEKPSYDPKRPFITKGDFEFDPAEHIIDLPAMIRRAQALSPDEIQKLVDTTEKYISVGSPTKFSKPLLVAIVTIALTISGLGALLSRGDFGSGSDSKIAIPGNNAIEKQINRAKLEGALITTASTEFATAVPFVFPILVPGSDTVDRHGNIVALSNSSPLRPQNHDIVFDAGRCRFLGFATWPIESALVGRASITMISCVLHNGDAYGLGESAGPEIGFVARLETPADRDLRLVRSRSTTSLVKDDKYIVRFNQPILGMTYKGKSIAPW